MTRIIDFPTAPAEIRRARQILRDGSAGASDVHWATDMLSTSTDWQDQDLVAKLRDVERRRLRADMAQIDALDAVLQRAHVRPCPVKARMDWADWLAAALVIGAAVYVLAHVPAAFADVRIMVEAAQ